MTGIVCAIVGNFSTAVAAQIIRYKKSIIANGNAQIDTAQSKFGGASALFDGTGDYLFSPSNSDFGFGTGDFTLEGWFRFVNFTNGPALFDLRAAGGTEVKPLIYCGSDGVLYYYVNGAARITGSALSANTWYHITVSRASGSTKMFVNGTQVGSTYSDSNNYGTTVVSIGIASWNTAFNALNGHADEIRISNTARYTANFTAPTTAFVNDANTLLLIHCNGTDATTFFEDDNGVRASTGITAVGNAQIDTAQSKFGGASALFDGTDDYLRTFYNTNFTDDFTIECWARFSSIATSQTVWQFGNNGTDAIQIFLDATAGANQYKIRLDIWNVTGAWSSVTVTTNTWYHFATVRSGSTVTLYIDGTSRATVTRSGTIGNGGDFYIGARQDASLDLNGHIDEVRISNTARYTTGFTPSTTPFVNDTNTLLLMHCDGTDGSTVFRDDNGARAPKGITALGNAQISTAQSKFGGASSLYDGTGDYLSSIHDGDWKLGTAITQWTIEGWFRKSDVGTYRGIISNQTEGGSGVGWGVYISSDNKLTFAGNNADFRFAATSISANTWYHFAIVRNGASLKMFLNGTEDYSVSNYSNRTDSAGTVPLFIGRSYNSNSGWNGVLEWNGYLDEIRISNSARYTAAFTPSTTPFQNDANTVLLLHMDGTNASTVFFDDNGIAPYTP